MQKQTSASRKIAVRRGRNRVNTTVTCRKMGPDGVPSCSRIGQRLFMFLIKHLGEYLGKTIFKPNSGKYLVYTLGRIEVRR